MKYFVFKFIKQSIFHFQNLNDRKHLHHEVIFHILDNVATYLDCLPLESSLPPWPTFLQQLDLFLRKLLLTLTPGPIQLNSVLQIILCAMKLPVIKEAKVYVRIIYVFSIKIE